MFCHIITTDPELVVILIVVVSEVLTLELTREIVNHRSRIVTAGLEVRTHCRRMEGETAVIVNMGLSVLTLLGCDENHTEGCLRTIDGR